MVFFFLLNCFCFRNFFVTKFTAKKENSSLRATFLNYVIHYKKRSRFYDLDVDLFTSISFLFSCSFAFRRHINSFSNCIDLLTFQLNFIIVQLCVFIMFLFLFVIHSLWQEINYLLNLDLIRIELYSTSCNQKPLRSVVDDDKLVWFIYVVHGFWITSCK